MIITLEQAQAVKPSATQADLDSFEQAIRELTNNKFQNRNVRFFGPIITEGKVLTFQLPVFGLRAGDTVEISQSRLNDGLYIVDSVTEFVITLKDTNLYNNTDIEPVYRSFSEAYITKIEYPKDIAIGVLRLLDYDQKMGGKIGIKGETISRMQVQYYDINQTGFNVDGYPLMLMTFLDKYKKLRWGDFNNRSAI